MARASGSCVLARGCCSPSSMAPRLFRADPTDEQPTKPVAMHAQVVWHSDLRDALRRAALLFAQLAHDVPDDSLGGAQHRSAYRRECKASTHRQSPRTSLLIICSDPTHPRARLTRSTRPPNVSQARPRDCFSRRCSCAIRFGAWVRVAARHRCASRLSSHLELSNSHQTFHTPSHALSRALTGAQVALLSRPRLSARPRLRLRAALQANPGGGEHASAGMRMRIRVCVRVRMRVCVSGWGRRDTCRLPSRTHATHTHTYCRPPALAHTPMLPSSLSLACHPPDIPRLTNLTRPTHHHRRRHRRCRRSTRATSMRSSPHRIPTGLTHRKRPQEWRPTRPTRPTRRPSNGCATERRRSSRRRSHHRSPPHNTGRQVE